MVPSAISVMSLPQYMHSSVQYLTHTSMPINEFHHITTAQVSDRTLYDRSLGALTTLSVLGLYI